MSVALVIVLMWVLAQLNAPSWIWLIAIVGCIAEIRDD